MEKIRPIQKLPPEIVGQIAAGEVVERPAAVVKELVENSIDAGATAITVELREGGISYLRVSDDGRGIPTSQIRMAFERHATSKITSSKDLFDVHTLGFRGEALFSIAAVSKVTLTTRTATADFGIKAQVEAGEIRDVREAAAPVGTTILVQSLFYNTPVRLKFLKKPGVEASLVSDYMMRLILSRPDISFRFVNEGKSIYQSVGDGTVESALYCVLGKDALSQMKRVQGSESGLILRGYVGTGELARGNRQLQSFFVNGRYFRDGMLSKAVESGCQGLVTIGKFPSCALYLEVPPQNVDVNVHPNKLEVRFQNPQAMAAAVENMVRDAAHAQSLGDKLMGGGKPFTEDEPDGARVKEESFQLVDLDGEEEAETQGQGEADKVAPESSPSKAVANMPPVMVKGHGFAADSTLQMQETYAPVQAPRPVMVAPPVFAPTASVSVAGNAPSAPNALDALNVPRMPITPAKPEAESEQSPEFVFAPQAESKQESLLPEEPSRPSLLGVAFQTYWLFEAGDRLLWVDQHAAHERLLYDRLWKELEGEMISQRLLSPVLVRVTARENSLLKELMPMLEAAGFAAEPFDETSVALHAIPTIFGQNAPAQELFLEALDGWHSGRGQATRERMRLKVAQMACKRAIKAGDQLSTEDVQHLLAEMLESGIMPTCPHGRPIVVEVTKRDMEKLFKRIQ